ncbi:MAG TPA: hypothetical protein VFT63_04245 [bacterium]|nr:hypothetical protein [bacterium]
MLDHENLTPPGATPHVQNGRALPERDFGDTDISAYALKLFLDWVCGCHTLVHDIIMRQKRGL